MNVLVVDMIEGFSRIGALASPRIEALLPRQVDFLKSLPNGSFVVFACDSHGENDSEFKRMPKHCLAGTEEAKICPELLEVVESRRKNGELEYAIVPKRTHSAFVDSVRIKKHSVDVIMTTTNKLSDFISDYKDWAVIGCVTDICVAANVMEMDYLGKNLTVYRDLVDTYEITEEQSIEMCGSTEKAHDPDVFNKLFFDHYFPGVWGVQVETWR